MNAWNAEYSGEEPSDDENDHIPEWADEDQANLLSEQIQEAKPDDSAEPEGRKLRFKSADTMRPRRIKWLRGALEGGTIPIGGITLLAGREGIGKSTITYDLISEVTRGVMPGEFFGKPKHVVIYATEDEWEPVIIPRLLAAKADLTRVHRVDAYTPDGDKDAIDFPLDLKRLAALCLKYDVALVVLDPIMSVINGKLDTHKDREVRQALDPLTSFAGAAGVAVLGLIHVNKSGGNDPLNSVMGSRAFSAVARSVLFCVKVESDDQDAEPIYLFTHEKCNLGAKQASKQYEIKTVRLQQQNDEDGTFEIVTSKVEWGMYDRRTARDILDGNESTARPGSVKDKILKYLRGREMVPQVDIINELVNKNITTPGTAKNALSRMVKARELLNPARGFYQIPSVQDVLDSEPEDADSE